MSEPSRPTAGAAGSACAADPERGPGGQGPLLVLVGAPASGKTTVGTGVAEILGVAFRDTDADIEDVAGTSVPDLFVRYGEPYFRALEEQAVVRALAEHEGVLALGGGAVTSAATRDLLVAHARTGRPVLWLDVDLASAAKRVGLSRDRPILGINPRAMLRQMLEDRAALYRGVATHTVSTGGREPGDVIADVAAVVHLARNTR
jgi:shikimate kinase